MNALGLSKSYAQIASIHPRLITRLAPRLNALKDRNFAAGRNPYGAAFAQLRPATLLKGRTPPPLSDTLRLKRSASLAPTPSGLAMQGIPRYGWVHMAGRPDMAKRRWFPDAGLPAECVDMLGTYEPLSR
jgi:phage gpG-like protein